MNNNKNNETDKLTLEEELERCKALAFYLIRTHRVAPEGRKQKKSRKEIDRMSVSTVEYMVRNIEPKILAEYLSARDD